MKRRRVTDYVLLGVLAVWIPMFTIGFFVWNMPARYAVASLLPMMLCAFAFAQKGTDWLQAKAAARNVALLEGRPAQLVDCRGDDRPRGQSDGSGRQRELRIRVASGSQRRGGIHEGSEHPRRAM